jgi:ABC-type branched-subunit amino acid transport system substrate-binding protein
MQWMRTCAAAGAIVVLAAFGVAGCGDDESDSSSGSSSSSSSVDKTPKGDPIVLYDITDTTGAGSISAVLQQFPVAEQAAVDHINKDLGGLDGRPFKLVKCDSKADPAATTACANQAVQDKALAKVGLSVLWDNGNKVFAKAGIASHNAPVTASDAVSPTSFPFGGGAASEWPGEVQYWGTEMGAKHGVTLADDNAQGQVNVDLMQAQAAKIPGFKLDVVRLKIGADPTPSVARAVGLKPDVVFTAAAGSAAVAVYRAFQQQGWPADKIVNTGATVDEETFFSKVDQAAIDGSYYSYEFETYDDTSNAEVKEYRDAMKAHSDVDGKSEFFQWGFADVMTVYNLGKKIGGAKLNQKSYVDLLKNIEGENVFMGGALSKKSAPPAAPQIIQPTIRIVQYKGGKVVPVSDGFFDPLGES